jgi:hypothetical protein
MNPLQRAAVRRKALYFAAILAIFSVSIFYRGQEARATDGSTYVWVPFGRDDRRPDQAPTALNRAADWVARKTILSQGRRAELRELEQGDPELAGEAVRLGLVGSRGLVVTYLWSTALEKQKRNDFHEFELLVRTVTKLQPHFITPWIFQSWNITYNISVELKSPGDMYFYIAEGIRLLAEGERRNKKSPDMRYQIGFYYQNKFGVSDDVQVLRALYQLSCIPPADRDPSRFTDPASGTDEVPESRLPAFRKFCEDNPHLIRRLREKVDCQRPRDVVRFLRENNGLPNRYRPNNKTDLAAREDQFPVFPPKFDEGEVHADWPFAPGQDDLTGYVAARAWFAYANLLVPPNPRVPEGEVGGPLPPGTPVPSATPRPTEYDQMKYRVPRLPMLIIFRQGPPRAQSFQAEMEEKDGWFDDEGYRLGWPADWRDRPEGAAADREWKRRADFWWSVNGGANQWFPGQDVLVGAARPWAREEWQKAATMWRAHGEQYALLLDPARLAALQQVAGPSQTLPQEPTREQLDDPAFARRYKAHQALFYYMQNRSVTNFPYFYQASQAEAKPETVRARKILFQAALARDAGNKLRAIGLYEDGLRQWMAVLENNPGFFPRAKDLRESGGFQDPSEGRDDRTEEQTYEYELEYIRLLKQDDPRVREQVYEAGRAIHAVVPFLPDVNPEIGWRRAREAARAARAVVPWVPDPPPPPAGANPLVRAQVQDTLTEAVAERMSPLSGRMKNGEKWVRDEVKNMVKSRLPNPQQQPQPAATQAPPSGSGPEATRARREDAAKQ